jgi:ATP-dependent DNA ligase
MNIKNFTYFYPEKPRLIHIDQPLFGSLSSKKEWVAERKYNGNRLQLHSLNGKLEFWNRHNERMDYFPPEFIAEKLKYLPGYCVLDGELRHNKVVGIAHKIMFYDVFVWGNKLLIGQPFWYRRNILKKLFVCNAEPIGVPEQFTSNFAEVFRTVTQDDEIEGLVIKNTRGVLNLGRTAGVNSNWMYKVRKPNGSYRF